MALKPFKPNENEVVRVGNKANKLSKNLSKSKKSKNIKSRDLIYMSNIIAIEKPIFLTSNDKKASNHLWLSFIKALTFLHFDLKSFIWIKTNILS